MSARFRHLSEMRLFVSPDRNVATGICAQGPTWDGGEQITFGRCANPEPGATGTATPQLRSLHCVPLGRAANAASPPLLNRLRFCLAHFAGLCSTLPDV